MVPRPGPRSRRATLAPLAGKLLSQLRRVRQDPSDEDAVHDARVAARRLVAAAELWLTPGRERDRLLRRLDRTIRRLGRVRNLDVSVKLLKPGSRADLRTRRELTDFVKSRRKARREDLREWLTKDRIDKLKKRAAAVLHGSGPIDGPSPSPSDLEPRLRRIQKSASRGHPMEDRERAHQLRREIRLLRYQVETLQSEYEAADFAAAGELFVRLQDAAGEWHDRDVLLRLARRASRRKAVENPLAAFRDRVTAEMKKHGAAFVKELRELADRKALLLGESR